MKKQMLLIGAGGFLGVRLQKYYNKNITEALTHSQLNIEEISAVEKAVQQSNAEVVINCAAISNTAYAQQNPQQAYAANVLGAANIAKACARTGKKLVYMSSDQVYNGCTQQGPLSEDVPLCPTGVYAQQKLRAEQEIQALLPQAVGLRLTWLYDLPQSGMRLNANLLSNLLQASHSKAPLAFATKEYRDITWVQELVENMDKITNLSGGIYNIGSTGGGCTYETALFAAEKLKLPTPAQLIIADETRYETQTRNLLLNTAKAQHQEIVFSTTQAGIVKCIEHYNL
ncbi:MAG: sugar nucleotide-binding protein [Oscillospiraceae bacterium]|nr:sugar nucleotide-binding protein [Oscillospiraceae bacterium]